MHKFGNIFGVRGIAEVDSSVWEDSDQVGRSDGGCLFRPSLPVGPNGCRATSAMPYTAFLERPRQTSTGGADCTGSSKSAAAVNRVELEQKREQRVQRVKNQSAYVEYVKQVPKEKRSGGHPVTPRIAEPRSQRVWKFELEAWKRQIFHLFGKTGGDADAEEEEHEEEGSEAEE